MVLNPIADTDYFDSMVVSKKSCDILPAMGFN